jgi:hypothetical protein
MDLPGERTLSSLEQSQDSDAEIEFEAYLVAFHSCRFWSVLDGIHTCRAVVVNAKVCRADNDDGCSRVLYINISPDGGSRWLGLQ